MSPFLSKCYWVAEDFLAGATFDGWSEAEAMLHLEELSRAGIKVIVSLAVWNEFILDLSQREWLQEEVERRFTHYVFPIGDGQVPTRARTRDILERRQRRPQVHDVRVENEAEMKMLATQIADRWHRSDMRSFAELLQANNPTMKVPEIR